MLGSGEGRGAVGVAHLIFIALTVEIDPGNLTVSVAIFQGVDFTSFFSRTDHLSPTYLS